MTTLLSAPHERDGGFSPDPLRLPSQTYFLGNQGAYFKASMPVSFSADPPSPISSPASSTAPSSPDLSPTCRVTQPSYTSFPNGVSEDLEDEDEITFPSYDNHDCAEKSQQHTSDHSSVLSSTETAEAKGGSPGGTADDQLCLTSIHRSSVDDTAIEDEPTRHVDYLSHEWREEDIWASWRYITARRDAFNDSVRLENASWRTWTKSKYNLQTVSPETLNWLKDCDVTWLYGPLQTFRRESSILNFSPPPSRISTSNSFLERKPILKKKSASETILQRSLSQHTLLKHAGAILKSQEANSWRNRTTLGRSTSDVGVCQSQVHNLFSSSCSNMSTNTMSSGLVSPSEKRHIHFNNEVSQCIAVEAKDGEDDEYDLDADCPIEDDDEDDESDDCVVMMKQVPIRATVSNRSTPRSSISSESKTIAPLPSTTLKFRDTPDGMLPAAVQGFLLPNSAHKLSPTPSVETLRPPRPQANFLLDDDDELDANWQPRRADGQNVPGFDGPWFVNPEDETEAERERGLHLSPSGMFVPYDESSNTGLLGRVVDTVNTARDIAHVIWNVGWRR